MVMQDSILLISSAQVDLLAETGKAWGFTEASEKQNAVRNNLAKVLVAKNGYATVIISDAIGSTSPELLDAPNKTLALHSKAMITTSKFISSN